MVLSLLNVPRQWLNEFEHAPPFLRFSLNDVALLINDCDFRNQRTRVSKNSHAAKNQTKMPVGVTIAFLCTRL